MNPAPAEPAARAGIPGLTSVVVVAADSGKGLSDCVGSVLASDADVEAIVSDNASSDGSIEALAARWRGDPRLRIVHNGKNIGFGAGCNRAAAVAAGDALLFLNPDCVLRPGDVAQLRAVAATQPDIGLLGALIVSPEGIVEPASRRRDPLLRRAFASLSGLARWESRWPALMGVDMPPDATLETRTVEAVSGAAMWMPLTAFKRVGGFDEGYFLHCEDLDLARRVRDAGLRVACAGAIRIVHGKGGSSRRRPVFVAWHKHRGMWRWFVKFDPAAHNPVWRGVVAAGLWLHFVAMMPVYLLRKRRAQR